MASIASRAACGACRRWRRWSRPALPSGMPMLGSMVRSAVTRVAPTRAPPGSRAGVLASLFSGPLTFVSFTAAVTPVSGSTRRSSGPMRPCGRSASGRQCRRSPRPVPRPQEALENDGIHVLLSSNTARVDYDGAFTGQSNPTGRVTPSSQLIASARRLTASSTPTADAPPRVAPVPTESRSAD